MKVLLVNGSSHAQGTTMRALEEMIGVFEAEGVETEEDHLMIRSLGCDYGQGYYYSPPVSAEEFNRSLI